MLAMISALVIASPRKTAARDKPIIGAKKLKEVAYEIGRYTKDVNENHIAKRRTNIVHYGGKSALF